MLVVALIQPSLILAGLVGNGDGILLRDQEPAGGVVPPIIIVLNVEAVRALLGIHLVVDRVLELGGEVAVLPDGALVAFIVVVELVVAEEAAVVGVLVLLLAPLVLLRQARDELAARVVARRRAHLVHRAPARVDPVRVVHVVAARVLAGRVRHEQWRAGVVALELAHGGKALDGGEVVHHGADVARVHLVAGDCGIVSDMGRWVRASRLDVPKLSSRPVMAPARAPVTDRKHTMP